MPDPTERCARCGDERPPHCLTRGLCEDCRFGVRITRGPRRPDPAPAAAGPVGVVPAEWGPAVDALAEPRRRAILARHVALPLCHPHRLVVFKRPRCPFCKSAELRAYRTADNGDDTLTRYTRCRACGGRFVLVLE